MQLKYKNCDIIIKFDEQGTLTYPEMGNNRDNLLAIVIGDNLLPIIVIAQNSFNLSITDIAFVKYFVIANKLSR